MNALRRGIRASAAGTSRESDRNGRPPLPLRPGFIGFSGHFPGNPILPAIVQVCAVVSLAEEEGGKPLRLAAVRSAKFLSRFAPARRYRSGAVGASNPGKTSATPRSRSREKRPPPSNSGLPRRRLADDHAVFHPRGRSARPAARRVVPARAIRGGRPAGIVWHGRYASYFEDARVALTDRYGIGYLELFEKGIVAPVRKFHVDYFRSLRFRKPSPSRPCSTGPKPPG